MTLTDELIPLGTVPVAPTMPAYLSLNENNMTKCHNLLTCVLFTVAQFVAHNS